MKRRKLTPTMIATIRIAYDKLRNQGIGAQKSYEHLAQEMHLHWQTIRKAVLSASQHTKSDKVDHELIKDAKIRQAAQIDKIVNQILSDLDNSTTILKGMAPAQSVLAAAQLIDKSLKLKGEDTVKIEINEMGQKIEKRLSELKNIKEALKKSLTVPEKPEEN
jgi:hypothetical protein